MIPVLAACGIRPPNKAFENTQSGLLLLADSEEEEENLKHSFAHLHEGVTYTVHRILTFITRLIRLCFQSLHNRFVAWTKPDTTSLPALDADRPCQKHVRARGRKRTLTKASYHAPSKGETACLSQTGHDVSVSYREDGSDLETHHVHCQGRGCQRSSVV